MASAINSHQVWAAGHIIMLGSALRIFLAYTLLIFGKAISPIWYRAAYFGALLSYSIVVYKSLGIPTTQTITPYLQKALMDDNVQYALLAVYWAVSKPVYLSLLPFATFSLFHVLTFIRTNILPKFYKPSAPATAGQPRPTPQGLEAIARKIQLWVKGNYDTAMRFVAFVELGIIGWVSLRAITWQGSFLTPLFLSHFIRMRYFASPFTREAVSLVVSRIDRVANSQGGVVLNTWTTIKGLGGKWLGGMVQPPVAPAGAGARPGGAGAGAGGAAGVRR